MSIFLILGSIQALLYTVTWDTTVKPMPEGRVLYEESAECTSKTRGPHKDQLASAWRVSHTLSFLKNMIIGWLKDNMNDLLARLNGSSIKDSELSKEITMSEVIPLATS